MEIVGLYFRKDFFITVSVILWKSGKPVSVARGLLVRIRSMQGGFFGFLKHVRFLLRFVKSKLSQKLFMLVFSGPTLKSNMTIWYLWYSYLMNAKPDSCLSFLDVHEYCFYLDYKYSKAWFPPFDFSELDFHIKGFDLIFFYRQKF